MLFHVVNIGYMKQNIVGHMSNAFWKRFLHKTCQTSQFFVYILLIRKLHGYAVFQNLSLPALKRKEECILMYPALLKMHLHTNASLSPAHFKPNWHPWCQTHTETHAHRTHCHTQTETHTLCQSHCYMLPGCDRYGSYHVVVVLFLCLFAWSLRLRVRPVASARKGLFQVDSSAYPLPWHRTHHCALCDQSNLNALLNGAMKQGHTHTHAHTPERMHTHLPARINMTAFGHPFVLKIVCDKYLTIWQL